MSVKRFVKEFENTYIAEKCRISGLFRLLFEYFEVGSTYAMVCLLTILETPYVVWGKYGTHRCRERFVDI